MELTIFDHILALALLVVMPIMGVWEYGRLKSSLKEGSPDARTKIYYRAVAFQWALSFAALAVWLVTRRGFSALGLGFDLTTGWWIGVALTVAVFVLLTVQTVMVLRSSDRMDALREQTRNVSALLPQNDRENRAFSTLSITAGVCEELLYRGFLIAYFASFLDTWVAVVLSSVIFGLGHLYQGGRGILKTGFVGLALAGLFLLTGSLWLPMLVHAVVDLNAGYLGRRALAEPQTVAAS